TIDSASLEEVISYTKSSITKRVQSLGKPHLINPVLEKIKVFPVSGYFALMHKIGKKDEAIKSGWDIEKTGFINLEKYLHEILFGGERARIIIKATAKSLLLTLENQIKIYEDEKKLLGQNSQDLHKTRELLIEKQAKSNKTIETIEKNSKSLISACGDYLKTMEQLAGTRLRRLQSELKNRISNDVNYNVKKNQELPKIDRIETIVETTMQDGLMDLVREYRFEFYKHILSMLEPFMRKSNEVLKEIDFIFDPKAYQDEAAKGGVLSTNHKLLAQNLGDCVKSMKPKKINQSMEILNDKIAQGFAPLESRILPLMKETGERVIESLSLAISSPLKLAKNSTEQELANLNRAILYTSKNAKSSQERKESIERKITKLKLLSKQIDMLSKAV
ncbi:MAG: hypothetical protein GX780_02080, partial [Campylobacteraceae bacterium]|nr:hypothetical protein [Campylobacteraceae bacterium]